MMRFCAMMIAAAFSVQPLPQADGPLEPSVQNEVDHAVSLGERWLAGFAARGSNSAVRVSCSSVRGEPASTNREERASRAPLLMLLKPSWASPTASRARRWR